MTGTRRRRSVAAVAAVLLAAGISAPAAQARTSSPVVKSWKLAQSYHYEIATGLNAVWIANADEVHNGAIYRVDPTSNGLTPVTSFKFPLGGMVVGYGSLWVSDYFGNAIYRLAPNGAIQARIPVGLQPQWMHLAFGSVWVSNHHSGSVSRVNATTNTVVATIAAGAQDTFRDGPQDLIDDGTNMYVVSSNLGALQTIDPATNSVTTAAAPSGDDAFCGPLLSAGGRLWSVDGCTGATYLLDMDGSVVQTITAGAGYPADLTSLGTSVWLAVDPQVDPNTGQGMDGMLEQRDPAGGALLSGVTLGGDVETLASGFGDLWVWDAAANQLRRVHV